MSLFKRKKRKSNIYLSKKKKRIPPLSICIGKRVGKN